MNNENHWLRRKIEETGTIHPVEVTYAETFGRVRIEMDENEARGLIEGRPPLVEKARSEGYHEGYADGESDGRAGAYDDGREAGLADGEEEGKKLGREEIVREARLAQRDGRLDDWLRDAVAFHGILP